MQLVNKLELRKREKLNYNKNKKYRKKLNNKLKYLNFNIYEINFKITNF
jgi:hypothetical protein